MAHSHKKFSLILLIALLSFGFAFAFPTYPTTVFFDGGETGTPSGNNWSGTATYSAAQALNGTKSITGNGNIINYNVTFLNATSYFPKRLSGAFYNTAGTFQQITFSNDTADCTGFLIYNSLAFRDRACGNLATSGITNNAWNTFSITYENTTYINVTLNGATYYEGNLPYTTDPDKIAIAGGADVMYLDDLNVTVNLPAQACSPNWNCTNFAACGFNNVSACLNVTDLNNCSDTFNGSLVDYNTSCVYTCATNWTCNGYGACQQSNLSFCTGVTDQNTCGFSYNGTLSALNQSCTFVPTTAPSTDTATGIAVMFIVIALVGGLATKNLDGDAQQKFKIVYYVVVAALIIALIALL